VELKIDCCPELILIPGDFWEFLNDIY
jgi:hypothetical protein